MMRKTNPTAQDIFDMAYAGVVVQGKPSHKANNQCAYRQKDLRCGVGHLISDRTAAKWDKEESSSIGAILDNENLGKTIKPWMMENRNLLVAIQDAHDKNRELIPSKFMSAFKASMRRVAKAYKLNKPA